MQAASEDWNSPLDPEDWDALRRQGHVMLDEMLDHLRATAQGSGPVWQPAPLHARAALNAPVPVAPAPLEDVYGQFRDHVLPYSVGNLHPGFMGWVHGAGTPIGMLAEMLAGGLNANLGGRDQMPVALEQQVVDWMRTLFSFPPEASGLFVTGSSMANMIGVLVARTRALGIAARQQGLRRQQGGELVAYASAGAHGCLSRAMDMAGLGSAQLRLIRQHDDGTVDVPAMAHAVRDDLLAGNRPFLIIGTAGSVDTGACDDLHALAALAAAHDLHFHVDGAYGALCVLSPALASRVAGIERADSIALDFHKWMHVPYDAGFVLVRSAARHLAAFADPSQAYLAREAGGMSGGSPWPCDFGPDLSRGFRALKTWMTLRTLGTARLGEAILQSCERARYLRDLVAASDGLELMAPVNLNIVCFRYRTPPDLADAVNAQLLLAIQHAGIAAPSSTRIKGQYVIRAALFNHRTKRAHLEELVHFACTTGRALLDSRQRRTA